MAKDSSRQRILDAALHMFSQRGFADSTTIEIARAAQVNERTLFRQFGTKDALLQDTVDVFSARAQLVDWTEVDDALTYRDVEADLRVILRQYYRTCFANVDLLRVFVANAPYAPSLRAHYHHPLPSVRAHAHGYFSRLADIGALDPSVVETVTELLVAHVHRAVYDQYMHAHHHELSPRLEKQLATDSERQARLFAQTLLRPPLAGADAADRSAHGGEHAGREH